MGQIICSHFLFTYNEQLSTKSKRSKILPRIMIISGDIPNPSYRLYFVFDNVLYRSIMMKADDQALYYKTEKRKFFFLKSNICSKIGLSRLNGWSKLMMMSQLTQNFWPKNWLSWSLLTRSTATLDGLLSPIEKKEANGKIFHKDKNAKQF